MNDNKSENEKFKLLKDLEFSQLELQQRGKRADEQIQVEDPQADQDGDVQTEGPTTSISSSSTLGLPAQEETGKVEEPYDGIDIDNVGFGKRVAALNMHECNLLDVRVRNDIFKAS